MKRNLFAKALAGVLAVLMLLSLLPAFASAAGTEGEPEVTTSGMKVDKKTELQADGTYTITLEAYSTGSTTTTTVKTGTPLDIVLVIDQSGSMDDHLANLEEAVTSFVKNVSANAKEYDVDHRIAIVGFASDDNIYNSDRVWENTGLFVNGQLKLYYQEYKAVYELDTNKTYYSQSGIFGRSEYTYQDGSWGYSSFMGRVEITPKTSADSDGEQFYERGQFTLTNADYQGALVNVNTDNSETGTITPSVTAAIGNLAASGATCPTKGMEMACNVFANNPIAEDSARKRFVVFFTDGMPGSGNTFSNTDANGALGNAYIAKTNYGATVYSVGLFKNAPDSGSNTDKYMNYLSSNYPTAQSMNNAGEGEMGGKYYMTTSNSTELENIFTNFSGDITSSSSTVTLTETAVMKDIIGSHFDLPDTYDENGIRAELFKGTTEDGVNYTFETEPYTSITLTTTVDKAKNTVEVSGLNYSENYIAPSHPGYKLVVTIPGVAMKDDAPINEVIPTNLSTSGIYADGEAQTPHVVFPQPQTIVVGKTYVLDYAKPVQVPISDWDLASIQKIGTVGYKYGKYDVSVGGTTVGYTPMTTNWNGYDSVMLFGQTAAGFAEKYGLSQEYVWSKVSMIPANNVYYEDTFVSDVDTGTVGITYSGEWETVESGNHGANDEDINGPVQGWVQDLSDDAADSDGTLHTGKTGAKATFTFSGTGFDLYSRTNMTTGKVYVKISWTDAAGEPHNKGMMIDTESASGEYYGIPTLWFSGAYNTYTVNITVLANSKEGAEYDYCIDGIRIYNPMKPLDPELESDDVINDGYKDDKVHAMFASVRDILLDANTLTSDSTSAEGVVFIDRIEDETGTSTNVLGTYQEYGPKNEVYLAPGQAIAFNVGSDDMKLQIGLKAPNGATVANFSGAANQATTNIAHSTDLYYWIQPDANGNVVIKNTGDKLLSVTKLKYISPDANAEPTVMAVSADEMLAAVDTFDAMPVVAYSLAVEEPEVPAEPEAPEEPDVDIENPDTPEEPEEPAEPVEEPIVKLLKKLFSAFFGWLRP